MKLHLENQFMSTPRRWTPEEDLEERKVNKSVVAKTRKKFKNSNEFCWRHTGLTVKLPLLKANSEKSLQNNKRKVCQVQIYRPELDYNFLPNARNEIRYVKKSKVPSKRVDGAKNPEFFLAPAESKSVPTIIFKTSNSPMIGKLQQISSFNFSNI